VTTLSVCLVTHGEREEIGSCLEGISWADEIIVVETGEGAGLLDIARKYTDRVYQAENRLNPNENKNYAFSLATGEWILSLDPDERVTDALKEEIRSVIAADDARAAGYRVPRRNEYLGRWLRRGGFYPDWQLRLFRRGRGAFPCWHIHERLEVQGQVMSLRHPLLHHTYRSIDHYFEKLAFKTDFEARYLYDHGVRPGLMSALRLTVGIPFVRFARRYLLKGGFLEGWEGFLACALDWVNYIVRYQKLVELDRDRENE